MLRRDLFRAAMLAAVAQQGCGPKGSLSRPGPLPAPDLPPGLANRFNPDTGLVHPASESEIADLIRHAGRSGRQVRVRGSSHSVDASIFTRGRGTGGAGGDLNLYLSAMRDITPMPASRQVRAQAGVNIGLDPVDPSGVSAFDNSLLKTLADHDWALPDLGGIVHQTVGGFLSTGSAGGSTVRSIYDAVVEIRLIDGEGNARTFTRPANGDEDDEFFGAVISMGLLGVVTSVTFQCEPAYRVRGREDVFAVEAADAPVKMLGSGADSLEAFLRRAEYSRILWWPQPGVHRLQVWDARRSTSQEDQQYEQEEFEFLSSFEQDLARKFFELFETLNPPNAGDGLTGDLFALAVNLIISEGDSLTFWDDWWRALPMDNGLDFTKLPTAFTEAWCPLSRSQEIAAALDTHYRAGGYNATGTNACEIYAAGSSPLWMAPSHGEDMIRIDPFWYADYEADPARVYFPDYWRVLEPFEPRYHWGKHMPIAPEALRSRFARWDDFLELRARLDPNNVFLTNYWRERLGIQ